MTSLFAKISQHKIIATILGLLLLGSVYYGYGKLTGTSQATHYALAAVEKGTIITSVTGTGQVSAANQVDVKPKTSGDVIYIAAKEGQTVGTGALLAQLDSRDAQKAIRDAQISLNDAQIQLNKLKLTQANSIPKLQDNLTTEKNNIAQAYQDGYNDVANAFLDMPDILNGVRGILFDSTVGTSAQQNINAYQALIDRYQAEDFLIQLNKARDNYNALLVAFNKNYDAYKAASRNADPAALEALMNETLDTARQMSQSVKDEQNILDTLVKSMQQYQSNRPIPTTISQYQTNIVSYTTKLNTDINNLFNRQNTITSNQQALVSTQRDLDAAQQSNPLDLASQESLVEQKQAALQDARDHLADYSIRAPFAGIVAKINLNKGDSVSSGTAVATMIAPQRIAEISLNEVDVAKIQLGQKATLTFDAVPDLTITGQVLDIDTLGTVTQGVVTYNVKIGFDTQDARIKPGMSVSAAIITATKQDVLLVPNSAIKSLGQSHYVQVPTDTATANQLLANGITSAGVLLPGTPQQQPVEIGLSNDTVSEVTNGLKEGDVIITRTITPTTKTAATGSSLFSTGNRGGTGGGNAVFRSLGR